MNVLMRIPTILICFCLLLCSYVQNSTSQTDYSRKPMEDKVKCSLVVKNVTCQNDQWTQCCKSSCSKHLPGAQNVDAAYHRINGTNQCACTGIYAAGASCPAGTFNSGP